MGANPVLSFWLAYILTRPLGANLGDWFGLPKDQQGLGLGVALTSVIFLTAIVATVVYLTRSRADVIEEPELTPAPAVRTRAVRERIALGFYAVVAVATGALLVGAAEQPHATPASAEESGSSGSSGKATLAPGQSATAHFPAAEVAKFRTIAVDSLTKVQAGDHTAATARIKDLETAWDDDQSKLQPKDDTSWTVLDGQIDRVLKAVRARNPDPATETKTLTTLLTSLQ
jgi:hypothetical protein